MEPNIQNRNNVKFKIFFVFVIILVFCSFSIPANKKPTSSEYAIESENINAENIYKKRTFDNFTSFLFYSFVICNAAKGDCLLLPLVILFKKKTFILFIFCLVWFLSCISTHGTLYILNVYT